MLTVVPMTVCGREKRHSASSRPAWPARHGDRDAIHRSPPSRARSASAIPTGTNTAPASEPSTKRPANTSRRRRPIGARRSSVGAGERERRRPGAPACGRSRRPRSGCGGRGTSPARPARARRPRSPHARTIRGTGPRSGNSIHSSASRRRIAVPGRHRPDHERHPAGRQHAVGLGDPALGRGPVLDRAGRDVAVEVVGRQRQRLGVAEHLRAAPRAPACARRGAAGAGSGRASSRTSASTRSTIPSVVKPVPAPASRVRSLRSSSRAASSAADRIGGGPEQRIDPAVVAGREEAVEPVRLLLVLDQPHAPPVTVPSR